MQMKSGNSRIRRKIRPHHVLASLVCLTLLAFWVAGIIHTARADLSTGLIGHWNFDEGTGTTVADETGHGNSGTLFGPTWTAGKVAGGLLFDGIDDTVSITGLSSSPSAAFTLSAWAKKTGSGSNDPRAILVSAGDTYMDICHNDQFLVSLNMTVGGQQLYHAGSCASADVWMHYVLTYDGTNVHIYEDGIDVSGNIPQTGAITFGSGLIIGAYGGGGFNFKGIIDDVRLYDRALTQSDVTELYGYVGDVTAPVISSLASSTTPTTATITFNTDESATSTVNYGLTAGYGTASSSDVLGTSALFRLTGLTPGTLYHYQIAARDNSGNVVTSSDYTFTTAPVDTTPPVISLIASSTSESSATITWTTNENATSSVSHGLTSGYGTTQSSQTATTSHSYTLTGLAESTVYHFRIASTDTSNNTSTSSDLVFTTTAHVIDGFYVANVSAGSDTGANCANAHGASWFNDAVNWGGGTSKVGAGDTIHLCGNITTPLVVQGSGSTGSPVTILFETGATMIKDVWPAEGAIQLNGVSWITIDGGVNGRIENTDNGPDLGHQQNSRGIGGNISGVGNFYHGIIKNLTVQNIYKKTAGMNNWDRYGYPIDVSGSDITIENNTVSDGDGLIGYSGVDAESENIYILNNHLTNYNHGMTIGPCDSNCRISNLVISGNYLDYSNTWDTVGDSPIHLDGIIFLNNTYSTTSRLDNVRITKNWFGPHVGTRTTAAIFNSMQGQGWQCLNWYIYNNVFETQVGDIWGNGYVAVSAENLWVFNNTFAGTLADPTHGGAGAGVGGNPSYYYNNLQTTLHGLSIASFTLDPDFVAPPNDFDHGQEFADALSTYFSDIWADYNVYTGGESAGVPFGGQLWQYIPILGSNIAWRWDGLNGFTYGWHTWYDNNRNMPLPLWNTAHADPDSGTGTVSFNNGTFVPTNGDTVARGQGANLTYVFTDMGVPAVDYDGNARPSSGAWTIGAYEVASGDPDTTPPTLNAIASSTTATTATITWNTFGESSTSTVRYGATSAYGSASTSNAFAVLHSIVITGLTQSTTYHFQVSSADGSGNTATSSDLTFTTTTPGADSTPPVLSLGSPAGALASGTTGATLSVTTDEAATCKYGTTTTVAFASIGSTFDTTSGTTHTQSLTGLVDGTSYAYYVRCRDGSSNANLSDYAISFSVAAASGGGGGGSSGGGSSSGGGWSCGSPVS
jgi:hypothetical protein